MDDPLMREVLDGLAAHKGRWPEIAKAVPGISYSWLSQIGRNKYPSAPAYKRLRAVADHLRSLKKTGKRSGRAV